MEENLNVKETKKKQNRKVTIFAIILSVISIGLLVGGFLLVSSSKVVMLQSISNLTNKFEKAFDDKGLYDKLATSKDAGMKMNINLASDYLGVNGALSINFLENKDDKKSKLDLDLTMDNQNLLDIETVLANDNAYFFIKDITPSYYHTALEYMTVLSSLEGKDYDKITNLLKDTVTDYIENDEIKKEKVEITYNGKAKKVNKLSYAITNKAIADIATNFVKSLKKDKNLLNNIAELMKVTKEEVVSSLDSFIAELTYDEVEIGCYYNVYYYGFNKIVKYELADSSNKPVLEYKVEDKEIINLYDENERILSLEVTKHKEEFTFTGFIKNVDEQVEMPFSGNLKDDTLTITFSQDGVDATVVIKTVEETKDNSYSTKNKITLSAKSEGTEITLGTLDINIEYYFGEKVTADVSNSKDANSITEEELNILQNNLMNHPLYQLIAQYIM